MNNYHSYCRVALRDIVYGEELTFDYSCVSESKEEFEHATCLCGSLHCRGSFLYYADGSSFTQIMNKHNHFLRRTSTLLDSCLDEQSPSYKSICPQEHTFDQKLAYLHAQGIKSSMLEGCPAWLARWCYSIMKFIEFEEQPLPLEIINLVDSRGKRLWPTLESAKVSCPLLC